MAVLIGSSGEGVPWRTSGFLTPSAYTIFGWFYFGTAGTADVLQGAITIEDTSGAEGHHIGIRNSTICLNKRTGDANNFTTVIGSGIATGNWYEMALTSDGSNVRGYASVLGGGTLSTASFTYNAVTVAYQLASHAWPNGEPLKGRLGAFKCWSVELSASELEAERVQLSPVKTASVWSWHVPVVGEGTTNCVDRSVNGRNWPYSATPTGFADGPPDIPETGGGRNPVAMGFVLE